MVIVSPGKIQINHATVELTRGDITLEDLDAIVNAANPSLLGGGGVDGAIHRAAGAELLVETRTLAGCQTGDAKITRGYNLKARHVIHAVGPIYQPDNPEVAHLLANAYTRSLEVAQVNHIRTLAFPSISTGAYGYPIHEAAPIALKAIVTFLATSADIDLVRVVLFDEVTYKAYSDAVLRFGKA